MGNLIFQAVMLTFQANHYKDRIREARTIEERIWLRTEYRKIIQSLQPHLN